MTLQTSPRGSEPAGSGRGGTGSWWLAALIVGGGLLVYFGWSYWLMHQPAPAPVVATAVPTTVPAPAPITQPTVVPTPLPVVPTTVSAPAPRATTPPTSRPAPTSVPTPVPTLAEAWWNRLSDQLDPQQEQAVSAALDRYYAVLTDAWVNLDDSHFPEVMTEPRLSFMRQLFAEHRAQGRAQRTEVDFGYRRVRDIRQQEAVAYLEYINHSIAIDLVTKAPLEERPSEPGASSYLLRRGDGEQWRVTEVVDHELP